MTKCDVCKKQSNNLINFNVSDDYNMMLCHTCYRNTAKVQRVSKQFIYDLLKKDDPYLPLGKYITLHQERYIAVDNEYGFAWTEEFDTYSEAIKWLEGAEE